MANTISGLRKAQFGAEGVKAQGTLTMDTQPTAADTVTVGAIVYTWVASGAIAGQINRGAALANSQTNFVAAINGTDSINAANPAASAAAFVGNVCTLTARNPGTSGNSIATTETFTAGTNVFNAATLGTTTAGSLTRGTAVAATSKIAIENMEWGDEDEALYQPKIRNGLLLRNIGTPVAVKHGTAFTFPDGPVVWEQLPHWLSMAIKGGVIPTYAASAYTWTFTRDPTTDPAPHSFTFERQYSDGQGNVLDERASYGMLKTLAFKYAQNDVLKWSASGFARRMNTNTLTAALTLPTMQLGVSALSKVYMDDTWGAIGGTQMSNKVIGFDINIGTGIFPRYTAEGRTDLDFTLHQIDAGMVTVDLNLTVLMDPTTYAAEAAKALAGSLRAIQIKVEGSSGRILKLNGLFRYTKAGMFKIGEDQGQDIVSFEMQEATDETNFFQAIVVHPTVNSLA